MNENDIKHLLIAIVRSFKYTSTGAKVQGLEDIQQEFLNTGLKVEYFEGTWDGKAPSGYLSINKLQTGAKVTTVSPRISYQDKIIVNGIIKEI